jgi:hypothetical protein
MDRAVTCCCLFIEFLPPRWGKARKGVDAAVKLTIQRAVLAASCTEGDA